MTTRFKEDMQNAHFTELHHGSSQRKSTVFDQDSRQKRMLFSQSALTFVCFYTRIMASSGGSLYIITTNSANQHTLAPNKI